MTKLSIALIAALAALSFGIAQAGDDKADKGATAAPADQAHKKVWTKEDAAKNGLSEEQFKAADTNGDGKLDEKELNAAGLQPKK